MFSIGSHIARCFFITKVVSLPPVKLGVVLLTQSKKMREATASRILILLTKQNKGYIKRSEMPNGSDFKDYSVGALYVFGNTQNKIELIFSTGVGIVTWQHYVFATGYGEALGKNPTKREVVRLILKAYLGCKIEVNTDLLAGNSFGGPVKNELCI